jgi:hypothetical protein
MISGSLFMSESTHIFWTDQNNSVNTCESYEHKIRNQNGCTQILLSFFLVYELLESKISESLVKALLHNPLFLKAFVTRTAEVCCKIYFYIFSF